MRSEEIKNEKRKDCQEKKYGKMVRRRSVERWLGEELRKDG